jgi:hypothetical protein
MADLQLSLYFDVFGVEILILIIVEAGIERLGLTSGLKIRSQLPGLEDRLDPADKGRDLSPEFGVGFGGLEEVQELFTDQLVKSFLSAEFSLDLARRFTLLDPDFAKPHDPSSRCSSRKLRDASNPPAIVLGERVLHKPRCRPSHCITVMPSYNP